MASLQELTAQVVALTAEVQTLTSRLTIAEQVASAQQAQGGNGGVGGSARIFDKKCLYPKELKETTSFRTWAERFVAWVTMDNEEVGKAFAKAARGAMARHVLEHDIQLPEQLTGFCSLGYAHNPEKNAPGLLVFTRPSRP